MTENSNALNLAWKTV